VLALFDLDGTITRRDNAAAVRRRFSAAPPGAPRPAAAPAPALGALPATARRSRRAQIRASAGDTGGCRRAEVDAWTAQFVSGLLRHGLFGDALAAIARHRRQGDALVLLSASTDLYVPAIGQALGFGKSCAPEWSWHRDRLVGSSRPRTVAVWKRSVVLRHWRAPSAAADHRLWQHAGDLQHLGPPTGAFW